MVPRLSILLAIILNSVFSFNSSITIDYYENLIKLNLQAAESFQFPTSNEEFKKGIDVNEMEDIGMFDFIIVGAGSAGSVLGTRLSEIDDWNILLLEAGGEENDLSIIPGAAGIIQFSEMNWGYFSTVQNYSCLGMVDKRCIVPRGKLIGGSSAINGLVYARANPHDFDTWAELGNVGWSYADVLPYFKKSENSQIEGDIPYHGKGGLLNVEYDFMPNSMSLFPILKSASEELNIPIVDYNGKQQIGTANIQRTMKQGRRQSTGKAFLESARRRKNINVITNAFVTQILIDDFDKKAEGVTFVSNDKKFRATARREIIVSAGAINSPQLLMLSGIGPKEHLENLGIPVVENLPVGEQLQEHPAFVGLPFHTNHSVATIDLKSQVKSFLQGTGPLTNSFNFHGFGFLNGGDLPDKVPMTCYYLITLTEDIMGLTQRLYNFNEEIFKNHFGKMVPNRGFYFAISLLHAKSHGRVTLQSKNPADFPLIDLNMLSEAQDLDNMIESIEFLLKLTRTEAFRKINTTLIEFSICKNHEKFSKQYWICTLRQLTTTTYHPSGTTPMGLYKSNSVVDKSLKVHGIKNLRIVDAGVFPSTISSNLNAVVIMVAEKISDEIKNEYLIRVAKPPGNFFYK